MNKPVFLAPRGMLARKPPHGAPCNGCGLCCYATTCALGRALFKTSAGPCPALRFDAERRSFCGVVADAPSDTLRDAALVLIRAGDGCDARFNGERRDPDFDRRIDAADNPRLRKQAAYLWGVKL
jgi:hypothetical protein